MEDDGEMARLLGVVEQEREARLRLQARVASLLEFTDGVVGQQAAGGVDELGRLSLAVSEMARQLRGMLEDERLAREKFERSQAELLQAQSQLQELDQLKSEFLNTVSHELRTPLTSIKAFAEILVDTAEEDPETRMEFLGIINLEADRLARLINNLLDVSRIEAGRMRWHYECCDLNLLAAHACETLRLAAKKKGLDYRLNLCGESLMVQADEDKMVQVISNLIGNALKFTPEGGSVEISTRRAQGHGEIVVADTGIGIGVEFHQRIFEKFGQVDTSETREFKGSGLGLPIARSIVEAHRGSLCVESELGRGSRFLVSIPLDR